MSESEFDKLTNAFHSLQTEYAYDDNDKSLHAKTCYRIAMKIGEEEGLA